jgi:hypothetical protein
MVGWNRPVKRLKTRRIYVSSLKAAYQLRPDFVMPYMSETAEMAGKALYLRKHGIRSQATCAFDPCFAVGFANRLALWD